MKIFNLHVHYYILLWISLLLALGSFFTVWYAWENTVLTVLWTLSSWLFVLSFLLLIVFLIEHVISIWYKINPWVMLWIIIVFIISWVFFSLHTKITTLDITSDKIEKDTKILLISDIHVDYVINQYHLRTIWNLIEKENPDMVLIAWDLLNRPHPWYVNAYTYFKDKYENIPILAIMWNHDVMWDRGVYQKISEVSPIVFLDNESTEINWIQVVWIVDKSVRGQNTLEHDLDETNMDKSWEKFTILMTHQPIALEKLKEYPIDLEVAWHTHRGQIYWFRKIVELMNDYGYWKFEENWKTAFVTQWIWTWWLPFRLWTQSEAVIINLKKK